MAIKWKNSKKDAAAEGGRQKKDSKIRELGKDKSVQMAAAAVLLTVLLLFSLFPYFKRLASSQTKSPVTSGGFLELLYKSNYIYYKDLREKTDGIYYHNEDLFLEESRTSLEQHETIRDLEEDPYSVSVYEENTLQQIKNNWSEDLSSLFNSWEEGFVSTIAEHIDYCVIDQKSGVIVKNTGNPLEEAVSSEGRSSEWDGAGYQYYFLMQYDSLGKVSRVAVSCPDGSADSVLKLLQNLGRENYLLEHVSLDENGKRFYYTTVNMKEMDINSMDVPLAGYEDLRLTGPRNATFIYGITRQQMSVLSDIDNHIFLYDPSSVSHSSHIYLGTFSNLFNSYLNAGIGTYCVMALFLLGAVAVILPLWKRKSYHLQDYKAAKLPLELNVFYVICAFSLTSSLTNLIAQYNSGYLFYRFKQQVPMFRLAFFSKTLDIFTTLLCLILYFGLWYLAVTSFVDLGRMGFQAYFRERCLFLRFWKHLKQYGNRLYRKLLQFDIGKDANRTVWRIVILNFLAVSLLCCMFVGGIFVGVAYSVVIYFLIKKYVRDLQNQYQKLLNATNSIAQGNFDTALSEDFGIFDSYKTQLVKIQTDFKQAVEEEVKSQRMKTELITNVSHDLKTPLTAITTYVGLLKDENLSEEERRSYISILEQKSERLKVLIEDLFEVSKATTGNIALNIMDVDIVNLMRQVYLEYQDKIEAAGLTFRFQLPEDKVILPLDSMKTYRIFENLYINIIKYALQGTRVYVTLKQDAQGVHIELKNISAYELSLNPDDLLERFVRADGSRNTEGSGLGLAIAQSFTELQHGRIRIEVDGDLFKVYLDF